MKICSPHRPLSPLPDDAGQPGRLPQLHGHVDGVARLGEVGPRVQAREARGGRLCTLLLLLEAVLVTDAVGGRRRRWLVGGPVRTCKTGGISAWLAIFGKDGIVIILPCKLQNYVLITAMDFLSFCTWTSKSNFQVSFGK